MALSISVVLLLLIVVFLLIKRAGLKTAHALVCVLLGFYLSSTSVAPTIKDLTTNVSQMIGGLKL